MFSEQLLFDRLRLYNINGEGWDIRYSQIYLISEGLKFYMAIFYNVIAFLGGLSMFLYGMRVMGDGLKSSSGGAMKSALAKVTNKPAMGFLLGMLVACIIQSSSLTSVRHGIIAV